MAPNIRSAQLETRSQRAKLIPRRKPYSIRVAPGIRLGYRRNEGAGTWSVVCADGTGGSWLKKLAAADDREDADGTLIMDYWQAVEAAKKLARAGDGVADSERPATVREAVEGYQRDLKARGGAEKNATGLLPKLSPALASKPASLLTKKDVMGFRDGLVASGIKASTVNRTMNAFIAALNLAADRDDRIVNMKAWQIQVLPAARNARRVILPDDKVRAIVAAGYQQDPAFAVLVEVLAVTGTRMSQALRLTVGDILPGNRLDMPASRKGHGKKAAERKPVPIPAGLAAKLRAHASSRRPGERLLRDRDGKPWTDRCQVYRFPDLVNAAGLDPAAITSYALRHSSIARQLLAGVPPAVVASSHDTSIKEIQDHYARYITDHSEALTRRGLLDLELPPSRPPAANDNQPRKLSTAL
jgi:integrase